MSIVTLPPMFFFAFVYYTDIPSITMILLMLFFSFKKQHFPSAIFGGLSVLMRQTNIVWVCGTLGVHLVDKMMLKIYPKMKRELATFGNVKFAVKSHLQHPKVLMEFVFGSLLEFFGYFLVILGFMVFLFMNGSIVGKFSKCLLKTLKSKKIIFLSWRQNSTRSCHSHTTALLLQLICALVWRFFVDSPTT